MAGVNHLRNKKEGERREVLDHVSLQNFTICLLAEPCLDHQEGWGRRGFSGTGKVYRPNVCFRGEPNRQGHRKVLHKYINIHQLQ